MRSIALRTKTVLTALTGAGILALGTAAAVPATGVQDTLGHVVSHLSGHPAHSGAVVAEGQGPGLVHS